MDFFARDASPMLIGIEDAPFNDEHYIYEWKLDGVRCLLYLDTDYTELRNKRNLKLNDKFPELTQLHKQARVRCILDGELYIFHDGEPDFFQVQRRTLTSDPFKIRLHSRQLPASFTAFDILYYKDAFVTDQPHGCVHDSLAGIIHVFHLHASTYFHYILSERRRDVKKKNDRTI